MSKEDFIARLSNRLDVKSRDVEAVFDSTIAELFAPAIFGVPGGPSVFHTDNDCNNNCAEELARIASTRG
jgi:hypothetical protein